MLQNNNRRCVRVRRLSCTLLFNPFVRQKHPNGQWRVRREGGLGTIALRKKARKIFLNVTENNSSDRKLSNSVRDVGYYVINHGV